MDCLQVYGRICRVCMCKRNNLRNMQAQASITEEGSKLTIAEMLQKTVQQLEMEFPVPQEICDSCMDLLRMAYRFQALCQAANEQLYKTWTAAYKTLDDEQQCEEDIDMDPIKLEDGKEMVAHGINRVKGKSNSEKIGEEDFQDPGQMHSSNDFQNPKDVNEKYKKNVNIKEPDDDDVPLSFLKKRDHPLNEDQIGFIIEGVGSNKDDELSDLSNSANNHCPKCNKYFRYSHHRIKHKCKPVSPPHLFHCEVCSKEFSSANMLQKHKRSKHNEDKSSPKAKIKTIKIIREERLNLSRTISIPLENEKDDNEINSEGDCFLSENDELDDDYIADADYKDNELEEFPLKTKSSTTFNEYPCPECKASFRFEKQLERHIKKHTDAHRFVCIVCNDRFKYPFMLLKHTERHHPEENVKPKAAESKKDNLEKSHSCNYCSSAYTNVGGLAQHMSKKHPEIVPFKCDKCNKTFVVEEHLKIHTNRHMGIKNFKCELCDKSFSFKFAMKQHMRIHTGDLNYLCTLCGKKFYRPSNLRQHMQRHGDEKPYSCPHCPKRFKCPSDRYIHLMSHQEGKNHVCSTCGARFSRVDTLQQHQVLHTGEKPYKCDQCPMAFPRLMNLNRHFRTHTGEKPYKCKYCEKAYAQSNDLNKHLRTHIGENTYICKQCPAAFKYQADLRNHEWEHYRKQKEEKLSSKDVTGIDGISTKLENTREDNN